ncbi:hypothetical protein [Halolactibacillus sp. JCM 19043]|uniref:hypothetical protein n=1 Tax=Halolactibacillus sp. JCM 19043 TaxID=1460638 RepID=UPI00078422D0|nr:hypothetical protein [Halolactibacillus sp. JCM 19043]
MYPYEFDEIRAVIDKTDTMHGLVAEMECREMTEEEWLTQFHQAAVMYVEIQYALLSLDINVEGDLEPYFTDAIERYKDGEMTVFQLFIEMRTFKEAIERKLLPYVCH